MLRSAWAALRLHHHVERHIGDARLLASLGRFGHASGDTVSFMASGRSRQRRAAAAAATAAIAGVAVVEAAGSEARCDDGVKTGEPWAGNSDTCALWRREWQPDWDGRAEPKKGKDKDGNENKAEEIKDKGRIRHLLFIRHGQYNLKSDQQELTALGREQSHALGKRLAHMLGSHFKDKDNDFTIQIAGIWSSDVHRARETAEIVAGHLPGVTLHPGDPILAEGQPALPSPHRDKERGEMTARLWEDSARIELAFRRYVHRDVDLKTAANQAKKKAKKAKEQQKEGSEQEAPASDYFRPASAPEVTPESTEKPAKPDHVYEIIVCHCNVIRYFVMRALQLPPEAWLRLGGYNTGITEISIHPTGRCSLIRFADTGHLPVEMTTFH